MTRRERFRAFMAGSSGGRLFPFTITKMIFAADMPGRRWATAIFPAGIRGNLADITRRVVAARREVGADCLLQFFLPQPCERFCIRNREEAVCLKMGASDAFPELCREIGRMCFAVIDAAAMAFACCGGSSQGLITEALHGE